MKKSIIFAAAFMLAGTTFTISADTEQYSTQCFYEVTRATHQDYLDGFEAIIRARGNYKTVQMFADLMCYNNGDMNILIHCDSLGENEDLKDGWRLIITDVTIPDNYVVINNYVENDVEYVDNSLVITGTTIKSYTPANITLHCIDDKYENNIITFAGKDFDVVTRYDDEWYDYACYQIGQIRKEINKDREVDPTTYDVNNDGVVSIIDAVKILRYLNEVS